MAARPPTRTQPKIDGLPPPDALVSGLDGWPQLRPEALYGLAGRVVATMEPHTEADPVAVLVSFLVGFGSAVGPGPHAYADGAEHPARLFAVIIGQSSKARKGTSWRQARRVLAAADATWVGSRVLGGLSSGEGLISAVADPSEDHEGKSVGGVSDKRLLVIEEELARVLAAGGREGNTLSAVLRSAWDNGTLRNMTKTPMSATGAHVSVVGHITAEELRAKLTEVDRANGFANRFLFLAARRSKLLPTGGNLDEAVVEDLASRTFRALEGARRVGRLHRSQRAEERWQELYQVMADDDPGGMLGAIVARAEAQVLRLSVVYALLDASHRIEPQHIDAAWALWSYCRDSATFIFGDALGDEVADRLLEHLRKAGATGLDGTEQRDVFLRHVSGKRLEVARDHLERAGRTVTWTEQTGGRPRVVTVAKEFCAISAISDQGSSR